MDMLNAIFTTALWLIFAKKLIIVVENVGILMLSIKHWFDARMDQEGVSCLLSPTAFFQHTEADKSIICFTVSPTAWKCPSESSF